MRISCQYVRKSFVRNMFASNEDDFDFPEDFLDEVTQKESQYYSQQSSEDNENRRKRMKYDDEAKVFRVKNSTCRTEESSWSTTPSVVNKSTENNADSRRNMIIERLKRFANTSDSEPVPTDAVMPEKSRDQVVEEKNSGTSRNERKDNRRAVILDRLKKKNQDPVTNEFVNQNSPEDRNCTVEKPPLPTVLKPLMKNVQPKVTFVKPVTRIREFPGPAGLLPAMADGSVPPQNISLDSSFDDGIDQESAITEYCSQNTTDLFSEGAWQTLQEDMDENLLNGHEISSIKERVRADPYKDHTIPFLAGIVNALSFSMQTMSVSLKDFSGSIDATIDKSLLADHPQWFDRGVVLFLGNVGLVTTGMYRQHIQAIVTLRNLINVYRGKSRMFDKSEMNDRLKNINVSSSINCSLPEIPAEPFRKPLPYIVEKPSTNSRGNSYKRNWNNHSRSKYFQKTNKSTTQQVSKQAPAASISKSFQNKSIQPVVAERSTVKRDSRENQPGQTEDPEFFFSNEEFDDLDDVFSTANFEQGDKMELAWKMDESNVVSKQGIPVQNSVGTKVTEISVPLASDNTEGRTKFTSGLFADDEDDSDELLSQLDIDSIASNYNK